MNFTSVIGKALEGLTVAASNVDTAISNYKAAKSDTGKAIAVADSLVTFFEELAKIGL